MKAYRDVHETDKCKLVQCLECKDWVPKYEETRFCGNCGAEWGFEVHGRPHNIPRWAWDRGYREFSYVPRKDTWVQQIETFHLEGWLHANETWEPIGYGPRYEYRVAGISTGGLTNMGYLWGHVKRHLAQMQRAITHDVGLEVTLKRGDRIVWRRKYPSPARDYYARGQNALFDQLYGRPVERQTSAGQSVAFAMANAIEVCRAIQTQ